MSTPKELQVQGIDLEDGLLDINEMQDSDDDVPNDLIDAAEEFLETYGDASDPNWYQEHTDCWH